MELKKKCEALAKAAPKLTDGELKKLNDLFPSYIFRRRRTGEIWTTCCGMHGVLPPESAVMDVEHSPEPKPGPWCGCHIGTMSAPPPKPKPQPAVCPFCGKASPVKELGKTRGRKNLSAYRRAVVFRWHQGALWASAYSLSKHYGSEGCLTAMPNWELHGIYCFKPGWAVQALKCAWVDEWNYYYKLKTDRLTPDFKFYEPFNFSSEYGMGYDFVGTNEIEKSPFRWCGFSEFNQKSYSSMRYFALCTGYARQVEMLTKAGLVTAVVDFVDWKKRNARSFNWDDPNPLNSFGLNKNEMRQFLAHEPDLDLLGRYKILRRKRVRCSIDELFVMKEKLGARWFDRVAAKMGRYRLTWERLKNYLARERAETMGPKRQNRSLPTVAGWWSDYIDAAAVLGYDLKNEVFLLPKGLLEHHDRATKAASVILEARRKGKAAEKSHIRCQTLAKRYTYSDGRYLIRPPVSAEEIVAEGKSLKHCVGGYADRHIAGKTTILFLRDREKPGKSLVTIEMRGSEIVQIQGWDDERTACKANPKQISPRQLYAAFLEPWLAWVAAGSRRDKKGRPKVPAKKVEVA